MMSLQIGFRNLVFAKKTKGGIDKLTDWEVERLIN